MQKVLYSNLLLSNAMLGRGIEFCMLKPYNNVCSPIFVVFGVDFLKHFCCLNVSNDDARAFQLQYIKEVFPIQRLFSECYQHLVQ
jgi:hypothetical protein